MNNEKGKAVLAQYEKLKSIRQPLDKDYRECYQYSYPTLGGGFNGEDIDGVSNALTAKSETAQLFDSTATDAIRLLSSSVLSSLTPPNTRWSDVVQPLLDEEDLDQDGKEWLEDSANRIHAMIHGSNYDAEALEFTMHQMIAGMAGMYVELKDGQFHFEGWPLNHLYCQETLNKGFIDTVYRSFLYSLQEAANEFGLSNLPQNMQDAFKTNPHDPKPYRFVVAIRPRLKQGEQSSGKTARNLPWESLWVAEDGTIVRESGFHEMPVIVPRWLKIPDTDYARGPMFDALPDVKTLNLVVKNMLLNLDMHISGMYKVKDDGVVNPATIRFGARRLIPVGDMENLQPLQTGGDIQFAMNHIASLQASIRRMLLADQLGPTEKAIQTATEVQTRNNQVRQILGPIFARLQSEFLSPLMTRCFGLVARAGLLAPPPDSIRNGAGELQVAYRSPLARSQKMTEIQAIDEMTARVGNIAQLKPEVLDYINFDRVAEKFGELLSVDPELINDRKKVEAIRYERQKQQAEQAAAAERVATAEAQAQGSQQEMNPASNLALMG